MPARPPRNIVAGEARLVAAAMLEATRVDVENEGRQFAKLLGVH